MAIRYNKNLIKKDRAVTTKGPRDLQNKQHLLSGEHSNELVSYLKEEVNRLTKLLESRPNQPAPDGLFTPEQVDAEIMKALTSETAQLKLDYEKQIKNLHVETIRLENEVKRLSDENLKLKRVVSDTESEADSRVESITNSVKAKYDALLEERDNKIANMEERHRIEVDALKDKITDREDTISSLKSQGTVSGVSEERLVELLGEATKKIEEMAKMIPAAAHDVASDSDRPAMDEVFVDPSESDDSYEYKIEVEDVSHKKKDDMANKVNKLKSLMGSLPNKRPA